MPRRTAHGRGTDGTLRVVPSAKSSERRARQADTRGQDVRDGSGELAMPLLREDARVTKREVQTNRVVVRRVTRTRTEPIAELLAHDAVEITRVPLDRPIDRMPDVRQEGDALVIPVVEERLVVERRLFLKEEVHVRRVRACTTHREDVTLRHHEVVVETIPLSADSIVGHSPSENRTTPDPPSTPRPTRGDRK